MARGVTKEGGSLLSFGSQILQFEQFHTLTLFQNKKYSRTAEHHPASHRTIRWRSDQCRRSTGVAGRCSRCSQRKPQSQLLWDSRWIPCSFRTRILWEPAAASWRQRQRVSSRNSASSRNTVPPAQESLSRPREVSAIIGIAVMFQLRDTRHTNKTQLN